MENPYMTSYQSWLVTIAVSATVFEIFTLKDRQESHAVAEKPRDAAVNSDRYQQPVGQKQSEWETENIT